MLIIREIKTFISDNAYEPWKKAMLPENKDATPGEIGHTLIQKQFIEMHQKVIGIFILSS